MVVFMMTLKLQEYFNILEFLYVFITGLNINLFDITLSFHCLIQNPLLKSAFLCTHISCSILFTIVDKLTMANIH